MKCCADLAHPIIFGDVKESSSALQTPRDNPIHTFVTYLMKI